MDPQPSPIPPLVRSLGELDDVELFSLFQALGSSSKVASRRALALLPEIIRRRLYCKVGFASPIECAEKTVGVTRDVVEKVLRLEERIGHMPELWGLLASGEVGWTKLDVVSSVVTPLTAAWWAERVLQCTRDELVEVVRLYQEQENESSTSPRATPGQIDLTMSPPVEGSLQTDQAPGEGPVRLLEAAGARTLELSLEPDPAERRRAVTLYLSASDDDLLRALQEELTRQKGEAISLGAVVGHLLREAARQSKTGADDCEESSRSSATLWQAGLKATIRRKVDVVVQLSDGSKGQRMTGILPRGLASLFLSREPIVVEDLYSRAIRSAAKVFGEVLPSAVRRFVAIRARFRCEFPGCSKMIKEIHHVRPRAEGGDHHPDNCQAVCRLHHRLNHSNVLADPRSGRVLKPGTQAAKSRANDKFLAARAKSTTTSR